MIGFDTFLAGIVASGLCIAIGHLAERRWSARPWRTARPLFNLACFASASLLQTLLLPLAAVLTTTAVNAAGGGAIVLPARGWGLPVGVAVYLVAMDLGEYLFHRAQHRIPALWVMHSFHHSDSTLNASTAVRHFWADALIKAMSIYLVVAIVFKVDVTILEIYYFISYYNYAIHMNVRWGLGRWSWALNAPQYHRIHHSRLAGDDGCNFAALLPIFDVLLGTYRRPRAGEYPPTGLAESEGPAGVIQALTWPIAYARALQIRSGHAVASLEGGGVA